MSSDQQKLSPVIMKEIVNWLRKLRKFDETAHRLFEYFVSGQALFKTHSVQFLETETHSNYYELVKTLKALDANGFGKFIVGRKGKETRITWKFDPQSMGAAANYKSESLSPPSKSLKDYDGGLEDNDVVKHRFRLRPDYVLNITLPSDFRKKDAARLSLWLSALPFD